MKLDSITIKNYRSIEDLTFPIAQLSDDSFSYGLIGINEAGKSSILKALALKDGLIELTPKDFSDKSKSIEVSLNYLLNESELLSILETLEKQYPNITISEASHSVSISFIYTLNNLKGISVITAGIKADSENEGIAIDPIHFESIHKSIFWTAEDKYLISQPINLTAFAANPIKISVPLYNCFQLAGIKNIQEKIQSIKNDSTETEDLQLALGDSVTSHIQSVWRNHPVEITFIINGEFINFHVKDKGSRKAKTADQRSDGFKQFISFLLTVSAENINENLSNTILLLDEPETHLHPKAQEHLLAEITKITTNKRNNIALFATHSNYMIDKNNLTRNFRVEKEDTKTRIEILSDSTSTYASVNYKVFGISSTDYYNELYNSLHENYINQATSDEERDKRSSQKSFDTNFFNKIHKEQLTKPYFDKQNTITVFSYIRNCIHHPNNGNEYSDKDFESCIKKMMGFLEF